MATITSITAPASYRILRTALTRGEPFRQLDLIRDAKASPSQVSRVIRWLTERRHVERLHDGRYRVKGAASVVSAAVPYYRAMNDALVSSVAIRGSKKAAKEALVAEGGILGLESALEEHSEFFRADRVCIYHEQPEDVLRALTPSEGGILNVSVYQPDIPLEGDIDAKRRTSKFRTVLDLSCDGKAYAAKELFEELWGVVID